MVKYQMSGLVVGVTLALLSHVARADDTEKWTPLMDGKTLAGWHGPTMHQLINPWMLSR